jgi:phage gp36-like protein
MTYIVDSDIEFRLGTTNYITLSDDVGTGSADGSVIAEARFGAIGEADSYLSARYKVPVDLTAHPGPAAVLKSFVLDLAEYRLHSRRPPVPPDVVRRHAEAVVWLVRVATGAAHLPGETALPPVAVRSPTTAVTSAERVFSRED